MQGWNFSVTSWNSLLYRVEVTKETGARQVIGARSIQLWSLATCSPSSSARWGGLPWKITNINLQNIGYEVTCPKRKEKNDTIFLPHLFLMLKIQDVASASPSSTYRMENGPSQIIATFNVCDHWPIFFSWYSGYFCQWKGRPLPVPKVLELQRAIHQVEGFQWWRWKRNCVWKMELRWNHVWIRIGDGSGAV